MSAAAITADLVTARLSGALRRSHGDKRHAAERIAREIDADPRAVRNWMSGVNAPRATELVKLMASCDEIAAEVLQLVEEARACSRS